MLKIHVCCDYHRPVVGKLISQQSQISTVQWLKFLLRAKFFKLKLLLMPHLQTRLAQVVVFCGRAILKGPKSHMWLVSHWWPFGPFSVALPQNTTAWKSLFGRSGIRRSLSLKKIGSQKKFQSLSCWYLALSTNEFADHCTRGKGCIGLGIT